MSQFRVGFGYDVHQLVPNRKLIVGGVTIPHTKGALGHSDADVLLHAISDALLGAAALGDIGKLFPDNNPENKDMDSRLIVRQIKNLLKKNNYSIGNIDCTIVLQKPKISPYIQEVREAIAATLKIPVTDVSVKASTTEHLGFVGREEGIAAYAVVTIFQEA